MLHHTIIIAEIGQNFVGNIALAEWLIKFAHISGASLAKFQLYDSEKLYGEKQSTELSKDDAFRLFNYGNEIGIEVFFSVFDIERVKWCEEIGAKRYKVAYIQKDNVELLAAIKETGKPVWVSGVDLYCVPKYPAALKDLEFNGVDFMDVFQGYSDHTIGLNAAKIAMSRGAKIIEKHFAIDHRTGIDAPWSMTPSELKTLRKFADDLELCL